VIEEKLEFSRSVHIPVGQTLEVPFRGTGWVFLGEVKSQQGMTYISRRSDPEGQSFILRAEAPGEYGLKFSKQDFVQDYILNDYVRVTVSGERFSPAIAAAGSSGESRAAIAEPRWPPLPGVTVSPPAQPSAKPIAAEAAPPPSAAPVNPPVPPPPEAADIPAVLPDGTMAEEYLRRAREEHAAGRIPQGIVLLEQFQQRFPAGSDEAWWLYGQMLEANSPRRDVRAALDYYRRLIQEYPQSPRRAEARRRAAYLERFYFNIQ
jgi:hypothetical protein